MWLYWWECPQNLLVKSTQKNLLLWVIGPTDFIFCACVIFRVFSFKWTINKNNNQNSSTALTIIIIKRNLRDLQPYLLQTLRYRVIRDLKTKDLTLCRFRGLGGFICWAGSRSGTGFRTLGFRTATTRATRLLRASTTGLSWFMRLCTAGFHGSLWSGTTGFGTGRWNWRLGLRTTGCCSRILQINTSKYSFEITNICGFWLRLWVTQFASNSFTLSIPMEFTQRRTVLPHSDQDKISFVFPVISPCSQFFPRSFSFDIQT